MNVNAIKRNMMRTSMVPGFIALLMTFILVSSVCHAAPTNHPLTKSNVLSITDGHIYLHNKRFAEISFNKFDLFWELYTLLKDGKGDTPEYAAMVASQDRALSQLHQMGFHSIRFFALPWAIADFRSVYDDPARRASVFYRAMDTALDLCDKNHIQVLYSLGAANFTNDTENERELMENPNGPCRQEIYRYIDDVVNRYKSRKTILMWEISNETTLGADIGPPNSIYNGKRMASLADTARFLNEVALRIKADDPLRLVNSGGSDMRADQWNIYTKHAWIKDTVEEQNKALQLLYANSAVDVVDIHYYTDVSGADQIAKDDNGNDTPMNLSRYMDSAAQIGKPLILGETGVSAIARDSSKKSVAFYKQNPDYFDAYWDPNAVKWVKQHCDEIVQSGAQLAYWWEYSSDRPADQQAPSFDVKKGNSDAVLAVIVDANKRLQKSLGVK